MKEIDPTVEFSLSVGDRILMGDNVDVSIISSIKIEEKDKEIFEKPARSMMIEFENNDRSLYIPLDQERLKEE